MWGVCDGGGRGGVYEFVNNYGFILGKVVVFEFKIDSWCIIMKMDCNKFLWFDFEFFK